MFTTDNLGSLPKDLPQTPLPRLLLTDWLEIVFKSGGGFPLQTLKMFLSPEFFNTISSPQNYADDLRQEFAKYLGYKRADRLFKPEVAGLVEDKIVLGKVIYNVSTKRVSFSFPGCRYLPIINVLFYIRNNTLFECEKTDANYPPAPTPVLAGIPIKTVVSNDCAVFYVTQKGEVYVQGKDKRFLVRLGPAGNPNTPTLINGLQGVVIDTVVCNGYPYNFFLTRDGKVFEYNISDRNATPRLLTELAGTRIIKATNCVSTWPTTEFFNAFFISDEGEIFARGHNDDGRLGLEVRTYYDRPTRIEALSHVAIEDVKVYNDSTFFITREGQLYLSGRDCFSPQPGSGKFHYTPTLLNILNGWTIKKVVIINDYIFFLTHEGQVFEWRFGNVVVTKELKDEVVVEALNLYCRPVFITADSKIRGCSLYNGFWELEYGSLVNFRSLLPQAILETCDWRLGLNRLRLGEPIGWCYDKNFTMFYDIAAAKASPTQPPMPVYMTKWLLSYPMQMLENLHSSPRTTPEEFESAKDYHNRQFNKLLNIIKLLIPTQPLLQEHTKNSITPNVLNLALKHLYTYNLYRLLACLSEDEIKQKLRPFYSSATVSAQEKENFERMANRYLAESNFSPNYRRLLKAMLSQAQDQQCLVM